MLSPAFTPWDLATSGLMTTLTGLPPLSGSVKAKVHSEPLLRAPRRAPALALLDGVRCSCR